MSTPPVIACPACGSSETRLSRWRSHEERTAHANLHPYRCNHCGHRFLAPGGTHGGRRRWPLAVAAASVMLLFAIVGASLFVVLGGEHAGDDPAHAPLAAPTLEAARQGDPDAQFRVARAALLDPERGMEATREAVDWLRRAAENGHTGAMIHLGRLYKNGVGTPQNYELAAHWRGAAARAGDAAGMVEYGRLHRRGVGVEQDAMQAYVWFNRAAAALNLDGAQERDSIALKLTPEDLKRAQALSLQDEAPRHAEGATPPRDDSAPAPTLKASAAPAKAPGRGE